MNWKYSKEFNPEDYFGFVYLINYEDGTKYIGKKSLWTERRLKPRKTDRVNAKRIKRVESNWDRYNGSSKLTVGKTIKSKYIVKLCKKDIKTIAENVKRGLTTKCRKCSLLKHNGSNDKLYRVWASMKDRCYNKNNRSYSRYGGRGIYVSDEFKNSYESYRDYVSSLDNALKDGYSIDRANNDLGYERGNIRWVKQNIQSRNTRLLRSTNTSGYRGVSYNKSDKLYCARITVDRKQIRIHYSKSAKECAEAYDNYVISNNLEHTINGVLDASAK